MIPPVLLMRLMRCYAAVAPGERGGYRVSRLARRALPRSRWAGRLKNAHGLDLDLDLGTYPDVAMAFGVYELDTLRLLRRLLKPGMTFVDGGANLGYFTLHAARLGAGVEAFEPDPANRHRLQANLEANPGLSGCVSIHPVALADTAGQAALHHPEPTASLNHGSTSLLPELVGGGAASDVRTCRLDAVVDAADIVKLDVEGAELRAISGATSLLRSERPPALIVEINQAACRAAGHRPGDLFREVLAANAGYGCWWIGPRLRRIEDPAHLDAWPRQGNLLMRPLEAG